MKRYIVVCLCVIYSVVLWSNTPYISRVYEYQPAPGQFINKMPHATVEDSPATMAAKAESAIANNQREIVCLGAWGGYIVFGFDHPVVNSHSDYDLLILGNAFYKQGYEGEQKGSSEPGIVYVSVDRNGNGLPDDEWYELAGSEYDNPQTVHNYQVTYYRTPAEHTATPDNSKRFLIDTTYIAWTDNLGNSGYIPKLAPLATQSKDYYPLWQGDEVTFAGSLLPPNGEPIAGTYYYLMTCYAYGYADNQPNDSTSARLKLSWAVDENGQSVDLPYVDFVRVQTGVLQQCAMQGEVSTEVMGAIDLHPDMQMPTNVGFVRQSEWENTQVYDIYGHNLRTIHTEDEMSLLPKGFYILNNNYQTTKFIKQ